MGWGGVGWGGCFLYVCAACAVLGGKGALLCFHVFAHARALPYHYELRLGGVGGV